MFICGHKKRGLLVSSLIIILLLAISACSSTAHPENEIPAPALSEPDEVQPTQAVSSDDPGAELNAEPGISAEQPGLPVPDRSAGLLSSVNGTFFAAAGACATCHTRMVDASGVDVSTDSMWRSTMMANATRDPYWRASVRAEVSEHPLAQEAIEEKCASCHLPMAWFTADQQDQAVAVLGDGFFQEGSELHLLAMDGISCTLCHQIKDQNLGFPESFSGGFVVDNLAPYGERKVYGPYSVPRGLSVIMVAASGYIPTYSEHVHQSALCATCHNLTTDSLDENGMAVGQFHEQTVFLEWQHSAYAQTHACQDCHMPLAQGGVSLSITGGPLREPFFQHHFVGGNVYMSRILDTYADELGVTASSAQLQATQQRTLDQLQKITASLQVDSLQVKDSELVADLILNNLVGHKLPSGFPSRRVWVHFTVVDADGVILFDSGRGNTDGSINGNDNDQDPTLYEPHYRVIDRADQVQIYEVIFVDAQGQLTTGLMEAFAYVKDNRLLPAGFDKGTAGVEIAVSGQAQEDEDFSGGSDRLRYKVALNQARGPFTVTAQLLYQTIGYRWMENLRAYPSSETENMAVYYDTISNIPLVLGSVSQEVGE